MRYILWVVALLEACDVTNNGRHLGRHVGFYQELGIWLKPSLRTADAFPVVSSLPPKIFLFTSAEREVKDSRRLGMYQNYHFLTRLGMQSLKVFGSIRLFNEVRAGLVRDSSRSLRFL